MLLLQHELHLTGSWVILILFLTAEVECWIFLRVGVIDPTWPFLLIGAQEGRLVVEVLDLTGYFVVRDYGLLEDDLMTFATPAHTLVAWIFSFIRACIELLIIEGKVDLCLWSIDKSIVLLNHFMVLIWGRVAAHFTSCTKLLFDLIHLVLENLNLQCENLVLHLQVLHR